LENLTPDEFIEKQQKKARISHFRVLLIWGGPHWLNSYHHENRQEQIFPLALMCKAVK
jgi:hypothetical protein